MILQLIDDDGKTILFEAELGNNEGEWNIFNEDEGQQLLEAVKKQVTF